MGLKIMETKKKIQNWLIQEFPDHIRRERNGLFLYHVPIEIRKKGWFKIEIIIKDKKIIIEDLKRNEQEIKNMIYPYMIQLHVIQEIKKFDQSAMLIRKASGFSSTLYTSNNESDFHIECKSLKKDCFHLLILFESNSPNFNLDVQGSSEEVIEKGKEFIIKNMQQLRIHSLFTKKEEEVFQSAFFEMFLELDYKVISFLGRRFVTDKAKKEFVSHFCKKHDPYITWIERPLEMKEVKKCVSGVKKALEG